MKQANLLPTLAMALLLYPATQAVAQDQNQNQNQNQGQSAQGSNRGGQYDTDIQNKLQHDLSKDKFKNVKPTVEDGVVTLQGTVDTYAAKEQAERKASGADHVQAVRDRIEVAGKQVPDDELRNKLSDKLRYDRLGYGFGNVFNSLSLGVHNGYVTLAGNVRDETDHASALSLVSNTPGVKGVHDEIQVEPTSIMDDELRMQLARRIYGDPALQKYAIDPQAPIRIIVQGGHVGLYGVVNSNLDKQVAVMRAREVPGTFSVDDHLVVANADKQKETQK
ncbi:MAG: transport-associated protein [Acidobacteriales bacterium]|nr:transport-associated protein [Terriglobales bacterium]